MPNPTLIHPKSSKIEHYLKITDTYIHFGYPSVFLVEPSFGEYNPDVYMKDHEGNVMCVEIQRTPISTKKMQRKIDQFVSTFGKEHDANIFLLVSNEEYGKVKIPKGFHLYRMGIPPEPYSQK